MEKVIVALFAVFGLLAVALSVPTKKGPLAAEPCPTSPDQCQLPSCHCSSTTPPGDLSGFNLPQIVYLTFDDAITVTNYPLYEQLIFPRKNPNQASIKATFFITHEYTNYSLVHDLWVRGHDIALHSITHVSNTSYWAGLSEAGWAAEITEQRRQLAYFARIPEDAIKGVRAPFLQMGGNPMYRALTNGGFQWDCSRAEQNQRVPGLWPYTNDYASTQDCPVQPCPDDTFPGFWTAPMLDLVGDDMFPCAMVDECTPVPTTQAATFNLLKRNFDEHYNGNRAPFGVFTHAAWLQNDTSSDSFFEERRKGYAEFLDYLGSLPDVFIVGVSQAIEWVKNPTPMDAINDFIPWLDEGRASLCTFPRNCRYENGTWERYMSSCVPCPPDYPWLGNPLGNGS